MNLWKFAKPLLERYGILSLPLERPVPPLRPLRELKMVKVAVAYQVVLGVPEIRKKVKDGVDWRVLGFAWVLQQKPC